MTAHTVEGAEQIIPMGPAASQIAIKQLGSNGGGFFNANSSHPFENPTLLSNLIENFSILLIPMAFVFMFGSMIKNTKQGRALFYAMAILFAIGLGVILYAEFVPNPARQKWVYPLREYGRQGNPVRDILVRGMERVHDGHIQRLGEQHARQLYAAAGMVQLFNIGIGEVIFGGVGVGLIGMLFYVILSMFVAGLMIGRTPEFMGKKFGPYEMVMAMISMLLPMVSMVIFSAIAISTKTGYPGLTIRRRTGFRKYFTRIRPGTETTGRLSRA